MRALLFALVACTPAGGPGPDGAGDTGVDVTSGTPVGTTTGTTNSSTTTTSTTPPWEQEVDCSAALPLPLTSTTYTWVPAHEDFTFSADGTWIGSNGGHLKSTPWGGPADVLVPGVGDARGTRFLPDGTVVLAHIDNGTLVRADPTTGSWWVVRAGLTFPNGIAIGVDGMVYLATSGEILRIDPDDGATEVVAAISNRSFDGLSFSPDYTRLYFNEEIGRVHYVDFDADGNPGTPVEAVNLPIGFASLLDGMTVDACGNLYATEMAGKVWRVTPTGQVDVAIDLPPGFIPALNFGPGAGGFERDHLYVQDFIGRMFDVPVGIPGKWEPHLPVP